MNMYEYMRSPSIVELREKFISYLENLGIDSKEKTYGHNVRATFFTFFRTMEFRESYNNLCEELCSIYVRNCVLYIKYQLMTLSFKLFQPLEYFDRVIMALAGTQTSGMAMV